MNGSKVFPLKFCSVRWIENQRVAARALDTFKNVENFVKSCKLPNTTTAKNVQNAMKDKMIFLKHAFFQSLAALIGPFLTQFQAGTPLVPFLYEELERLMRNIMQWFINTAALQAADTVRKLIWPSIWKKIKFTRS